LQWDDVSVSLAGTTSLSVPLSLATKIVKACVSML